MRISPLNSDMQGTGRMKSSSSGTIKFMVETFVRYGENAGQLS